MPAPEDTPSLEAPNQIDTYNALKVADKVLWPMVDAFWRGDFRETAEPGDGISLQKSASYSGAFYIVELEAGVDIAEKKKDPVVRPYDGLTLTIGKALLGYQRKLVLEEAFASGDIGKKHMTSNQVLARSVREYFSVPNNKTFAMTTYQAVGYISENEYLWSNYNEPSSEMDGSEDEDEVESNLTPFIDSNRLLDIDLEQIEAAIYVLDVPKTISKRFQKIKAKPDSKMLKIKKS